MKKIKIYFQRNKMIFGVMAFLLVTGLVMASFMGFLMPWEPNGGDTSPTPGVAPTVTINEFLTYSNYLRIGFTITDSDSQIRSYYVILYITGIDMIFLDEHDVASGPYGSSVDESLEFVYADYGIITTESEQKTVKVECTDTQGKYAFAEESAVFSSGVPPTATVAFPVVDEEVGYAGEKVVIKSAGLFPVILGEVYAFAIPVRLALIDLDGDLSAYSIEIKIVPSWGDVSADVSIYQSLTSDSLSGEIYDRVIKVVYIVSWGWSLQKQGSTVGLSLSFYFHLTDSTGNDELMTTHVQIIGDLGAKTDLDTEESDLTITVEDNTDGDYYKEFDSDKGAHGFELPLVILAIIYWIRKRKKISLR